MIDLNETKLIGNLAADSITSVVGETTVTRGRLIRSNSHKDRESGKWLKSEAMAFDFEVWGNFGTAFAEKAKKGTSLLIEGSWIPNHFTKEDGTKFYGLRLRVNRWQIVAHAGTKAAASSEQAQMPLVKRRRTATAANA